MMSQFNSTGHLCGLTQVEEMLISVFIFHLPSPAFVQARPHDALHRTSTLLQRDERSDWVLTVPSDRS